MLQHPLRSAGLCLLALLALQSPPDAEEAEWQAAMALKQKSAHVEAAAAFAKFAAAHPASNRALTCAIEEGVCLYSAGRAEQVLHRATPAATEKFEKALALFRKVSEEHASAPEAPRAAYMQGMTHLFRGELELAHTDFTTVIDKLTSDRSYVGKALSQRALVRRSLLRTADAIADLNRWIKEFGAPADALEKARRDLARAQLLDKPAPALAAETWFSEPVPLDSQQGNLVALYFFATWCPNCAAELPFVLDFEQRLGPRGVRFIGVVDHQQGQTPEVVRAHLLEHRIPFAVFQDNHATSTAYRVTTIPTLALIDRFGRLRWCDNASILSDWTVEKLLAEGTEQPPGK